MSAVSNICWAARYGRFEKRLAQVRRHFGDARERSLQVQVAGVNKPERGLRHRRLLAYE